MSVKGLCLFFYRNFLKFILRERELELGGVKGRERGRERIPRKLCIVVSMEPGVGLNLTNPENMT